MARETFEGFMPELPDDLDYDEVYDVGTEAYKEFQVAGRQVAVDYLVDKGFDERAAWWIVDDYLDALYDLAYQYP